MKQQMVYIRKVKFSKFKLRLPLLVYEISTFETVVQNLDLAEGGTCLLCKERRLSSDTHEIILASIVKNCSDHEGITKPGTIMHSLAKSLRERVIYYRAKETT